MNVIFSFAPPQSPDGSSDFETSDVKSSENHSHPTLSSLPKLWFIYMGLLFVPFALLVVIFAAPAGAFSGFLTIIVGHAILRAAHRAGYEPPLSSSMKAGAAGGAVLSGFTLCTCIILYKLHQMIKHKKAISPFVECVVGTAMVAATSAASSATGAEFMYQYHPQMDCLDLTHAARAGAFGAVVLSSAFLLWASAALVVWAVCAKTDKGKHHPTLVLLLTGIGKNRG